MYEPLLLIKMNDPDGTKFPELDNLDIRVRVSSGGHTSRLYAVRQAIAKSVLAYFQKCELLVLSPLSHAYVRTRPHTQRECVCACVCGATRGWESLRADTLLPENGE